ncbi:unnamed protein product, partial [Amoebophrya sp. A25]
EAAKQSAQSLAAPDIDVAGSKDTQAAQAEQLVGNQNAQEDDEQLVEPTVLRLPPHKYVGFEEVRGYYGFKTTKQEQQNIKENHSTNHTNQKTSRTVIEFSLSTTLQSKQNCRSLKNDEEPGSSGTISSCSSKLQESPHLHDQGEDVFLSFPSAIAEQGGNDGAFCLRVEDDDETGLCSSKDDSFCSSLLARWQHTVVLSSPFNVKNANAPTSAK